ncbi:glycoside hydrolase superfamily [Mucor mucedo]|uniref:glycoside hydrolase superfamily n=1 Tax=Mucor mucedo TaxID=29922 RepID=UPI00221F1006|nr:glycoside hydrolase superfamily [Mucor mucedo]KAI7888732.1 glycoside hydrolase superfamily [Mucor mucedo]
MLNLSLILSIASLVSSTLAASSAFYGLNYGVNMYACPTLEDVKRDFRILSQYTNTVRIYSIKDCNLGELALKASQATKLRLYLGMWVDKSDSFDREFSALKTIAESNRFYNVEAIIVGSEVMYRGDLEPNELVDRIEKVKSLVSPLGQTKVTTADVYYKFTPEIINAVDFVMMNAFIYWEGINVDQATDTLMAHYQSVKDMSNGKLVRISETGWPDQGDQNMASIPSSENQKNFLLQTLCRTKQQEIDMIWFSAIDEGYKPGVESHFGLLDSNRQLKKDYTYEKLMNPC